MFESLHSDQSLSSFPMSLVESFVESFRDRGWSTHEDQRMTISPSRTNTRVKECIIPAPPGWYVVEEVIDPDLTKVVDLCQSPIVAWSIRDRGAEVVPVLPYGAPGADFPIIKDPDGYYWMFDGSTKDQKAVMATLQIRLDERVARFKEINKRAVSGGGT